MGKRPIIIAGPCSAESEEQIQRTACEIARIGVPIFRAGLWKPRTSPGSFEGVGEVGIEWLKQVKNSRAINVATEVATATQIRKVVESGINMMWIGARTTSNPFVMQELSNYLKTLPKGRLDDITIMIKNPINYDIKLWVGAIERIKMSGVKNIWLILRGFTPSGKSLYRNIPYWSVISKMKSIYPECLILCDPSHIAGDKKYILDLSEKALQMGADGLMIECHRSPMDSLTDKAQQISPSELEVLLAEVNNIPASANPSLIDDIRLEIDDIDECILNLLGHRMDLSKKIAKAKLDESVNIDQPEREKEVVSSRLSYGARIGLNASFISDVMNVIINESKGIQAQTFT